MQCKANKNKNIRTPYTHRLASEWMCARIHETHTAYSHHTLAHSFTHSVAQSVACRRRAHTTEEKKKKKKHTHFIHHRRTRADVHANKYVHIFKETKAEHREQLHSLPYCIKGFFRTSFWCNMQELQLPISASMLLVSFYFFFFFFFCVCVL